MLDDQTSSPVNLVPSNEIQRLNGKLKSSISSKSCFSVFHRWTLMNIWLLLQLCVHDVLLSLKAKSWIESIQRREYVKQRATTVASDHGSVVAVHMLCHILTFKQHTLHRRGYNYMHVLPLAVVVMNVRTQFCGRELMEPEKEKWTQMFWWQFMLSMKACFRCIAGFTWWDEGRSLTPPPHPPIVHSELTSILFPVLRTHQSMMPRVELPQG